MNVDFFIWRPIIEGVVGLQEMDEYWNINDVADAHEALDIKQEVEDFYYKNLEEDK